jgi:hypothetical protein
VGAQGFGREPLAYVATPILGLRESKYYTGELLWNSLQNQDISAAILEPSSFIGPIGSVNHRKRDAHFFN